MKKIVLFILIIGGLLSCNPTLTTFTFIYNDEGPNKEIALKMEELLESEYYNVDIKLIKGINTNANLDSLVSGDVDIALVENYVDYMEGVNSAFSVYSEVLHIFYKEGKDGGSFESLIHDNLLYMGRESSPTYNLMMDLFSFYGLDEARISVTMNMQEADVIVELTNLFSQEKLASYKGYKLFSFDDIDALGNASVVEGISLKYPRLSPFVIPKNAYWKYTEEPVVTLSVDLIMVVRSGMMEVSVNDFARTMLRNRQIFTAIDPLLFNGLKEDFDKGILNIPLHEGARIFLDRDEPSFIERYAELGGVILSIVIAIISGIISLTKWQAQKKKDEIDEFYEDLMNIKNAIRTINTIPDAIRKVKHVQEAQNK
ncbi:MAG: TAXI family TRAP transporter solute-binding subunit, partial [Bacteroidota bacterium]